MSRWALKRSIIRHTKSVDWKPWVQPEFYRRLQGVAVHDHWKSYWHFKECLHALCNSHHLRELDYFEELTGHYWPIGLRNVLMEAKKAVAAAQQEKKAAPGPDTLALLSQRYDQYVKAGLAAWPEKRQEPHQKGRIKQEDATNLLVSLRDYKTEVPRHLTDWQVPFDNNPAERMVLPCQDQVQSIRWFSCAWWIRSFLRVTFRMGNKQVAGAKSI